MYLLKDSEGNLFYLRSSKVIKVGRKLGDILLTNDTSVSKEHATLTVELEQNSKDRAQFSLIVRDTNSKYGSTIVSNSTGKKTKVTKEGNTLEHMDKVTFGLQNNTYTVFFIPLITVVSKLKKEESEKLANIMQKVDGVIYSSWNDECTHLTTVEATLTQKIVFALASCIPVVGLNYWEAVLDAVQTNRKLPDGAEYSLMVKESHIVHSLSPNPKRESLFSGLTFVHFCHKQQRSLLPMIECAGGKSVRSSDINLDNVNEKNLLFVQLTTDESQYQTQAVSAYRSITTLLKSNNKRVIGATEIPLAILYCSTEKQCNPEYDFGNLIRVPTENSNVLNSAILREDTQDVSHRKNKVPVVHNIINETNDSIADFGTFISQNDVKNGTDLRVQENEKTLPNKMMPPQSPNVKNRVTRIVPETIESVGASQIADNSSQETSFMFSDDLDNLPKGSTSHASSQERKNENSGVKRKAVTAFSFNDDDDDEEMIPPTKKPKEQEKLPKEQEKSKDDWGFTKSNEKYDDFEDFDVGKNEGKKKTKEVSAAGKLELKKHVEADAEFGLDKLQIDLQNGEKRLGKRKRSDDFGENVPVEKKKREIQIVDSSFARASSVEEEPPEIINLNTSARPRKRNVELNESLPFLRVEPNSGTFGKIFQKVYNRIPERIQLPAPRNKRSHATN